MEAGRLVALDYVKKSGTSANSYVLLLATIAHN